VLADRLAEHARVAGQGARPRDPRVLIEPLDVALHGVEGSLGRPMSPEPAAAGADDVAEQ
jgi:hypothetical protein